MAIRFRLFITCSTNTWKEPDESLASPKPAPPGNEWPVILAFEVLFEAPLLPRYGSGHVA
jgi:hypothetical protein